MSPPPSTPWHEGQRITSSRAVSTRLQSTGQPFADAVPVTGTSEWPIARPCVERATSSNELAQTPGIARCVRSRVVVEVREHVQPLVAPRTDAGGPLGQRRIVIRGGVEAPGSVKAQVNEVGGHREPARPAWRVDDAERD